MKTQLRVFAIVVFILVIGCGTASAYNKTNMQSVIINMDGTPKMVSTEQETVGGLLAELQETISTEYILADGDEEDLIEEMMTISLTAVTTKTVATMETIPYQTIERENAALAYGERRVVQEGAEGQKSVIFQEIYHGEELVRTEPLEEKILTEAQDEIIEIGVAKKINGMVYREALQMRVTAYTPYDPGCNGITYTGTKAGQGTIAVDPKVIPLGSKVYIPGYGVGIASDIGGAIKGNRLDVCYASRTQALNWGVKNLQVYVLA